jgi:hypothetical protein
MPAEKLPLGLAGLELLKVAGKDWSGRSLEQFNSLARLGAPRVPPDERVSLERIALKRRGAGPSAREGDLADEAGPGEAEPDRVAAGPDAELLEDTEDLLRSFEQVLGRLRRDGGETWSKTAAYCSEWNKSCETLSQRSESLLEKMRAKAGEWSKLAETLTELQSPVITKPLDPKAAQHKEKLFKDARNLFAKLRQGDEA